MMTVVVVCGYTAIVVIDIDFKFCQEYILIILIWCVPKINVQNNLEISNFYLSIIFRMCTFLSTLVSQ